MAPETKEQHHETCVFGIFCIGFCVLTAFVWITLCERMYTLKLCKQQSLVFAFTLQMHHEHSSFKVSIRATNCENWNVSNVTWEFNARAFILLCWSRSVVGMYYHVLFYSLFPINIPIFCFIVYFPCICNVQAVSNVNLYIEFGQGFRSILWWKRISFKPESNTEYPIWLAQNTI